MSLRFAKPLVVWNGGLRTTGCAVACVGSIGRAFSPEGLRETGVNEVCADKVEDGKVDAFNPSILSMSVRRNSDVLDSELAHVVVPFLRSEFPPVVTAKGLDLVSEDSLDQTIKHPTQFDFRLHDDNQDNHTRYIFDIRLDRLPTYALAHST